MDTTTGAKAVLWGSIAGELMGVLYDMRYMVMLSVVLIIADMWWGYSESHMRLAHAKEIGNATLQEQFKWHKSRAVRRTANKFVDYMTYLVVGAGIGLAITEPLEICSHVWTAAIGLGLGCACEIASIVGHVAYVKMGVELSLIDGWKVFVRFLGRIIKSKSEDIGDAVEELGRDHRHRHHHYEQPDIYDEEQNMED